MGASENFLPTPDSNPIPSQTVYAVESGRIDAANSDALKSPTAKRMYAYCPARGFNAAAASAAYVMVRYPCTHSVAAQATIMNHATTSVKMHPVTTSIMDAL